MDKRECVIVAALVALSFAFLSCAPASAGRQPDARVPILLYHSRHVDEPCTYGHNDLLARQQAINLHYSTPVYWINVMA